MLKSNILPINKETSMPNLPFNQPVSDLIRLRFSCRSYRKEPIPETTQAVLQSFCNHLPSPPFGTAVRFFVAARTNDADNPLQGLGTYGFIRNPAGFLIGAAARSGRDMEDFGYLLELLILRATDLGLGTCWLGGSFTRSSFAAKINLTEHESMPAVSSIGLPVTVDRNSRDLLQIAAGSHSRLPWEKLFFNANFNQPLNREACGEFSRVLEMVRIGPSASNKQPWRIVRDGKHWHFFLQRSAGYRKGIINSLLGIADLQRVDMGIAMCHFDAAAHSAGLSGRWVLGRPSTPGLDANMEYSCTWIEE